MKLSLIFASIVVFLTSVHSKKATPVSVYYTQAYEVPYGANQILNNSAPTISCTNFYISKFDVQKENPTYGEALPGYSWVGGGPEDCDTCLRLTDENTGRVAYTAIVDYNIQYTVGTLVMWVFTETDSDNASGTASAWATPTPGTNIFLTAESVGQASSPGSPCRNGNRT